MRIIISPAKKMIKDNDDLGHLYLPRFIKESENLLAYLQRLDYEKLKTMWKCNDKIAELNYNRIQDMDLYNALTPAILSYEGIQYQYMSPGVLTNDELKYINKHLRILSGFYGILRPFDGVVPYRLEMQVKPVDFKVKSLYDFWGEKIAKQLFSESTCILNLASKEYSKCISSYINKDIRFVSCIFGEIINDKVVEKGTYAKMARGEMVRFIAQNQVKDIEEIKNFSLHNYTFRNQLSNENTYVFIR